MKITNMIVENYGPFAVPTEIKFEPNLTILTGPNDSGKTAALQLLKLIWEKGAISDNEINFDRMISAKTDWKNDRTCGCKFYIDYSKFTEKYFRNVSLTPYSRLMFEYIFPPHVASHNITLFHNNTDKQNAIVTENFVKNPKVLFLTSPFEQVNPILNLDSLNYVERKLLTLAFGSNPENKIKSLSSIQTHSFFEKANDNLGQRLKQVLPSSLDYKIKFAFLPDNRLTLSFEDERRNMVPLSLRGQGIRNLVSMLSFLLDEAYTNEFVYVLIDEPENTLHADAQHILRRFLEELGKKENYQVIYTTHSPAMINPYSGNNVRLFTRGIVDGMPTTVVNNNPCINNFEPVRTSLGVSFADSLLFGEYTIVTEGKTEVKCLPIIIKLISEKVEEFKYIADLLPELFILDGGGDSFDYWCRLIKQQGSKPILFVDGDKTKRVEALKKVNKLDGIPIFMLDVGKEFEDIIPLEDYFNGLRKYTNEKRIQADSFLDWLSRANQPKQKLISKKVDDWLLETFPDVDYDKPNTMKTALEDCDFSKINIEPFEKLLREIKNGD